MVTHLPKDNNSSTIPLIPAKIALSTTYSTSISSSTTVAITAGATIIEISAISQPVLIKWGSTSVTTSNFDSIIQPGTTRHYVIPVDQTVVPNLGALYTTMRVIEQAASATVAITQF